MKIRRANAKDAVALSRLEKELFSKVNFPLSKSSFSYHIKNNLLSLVEIENEVVAYILVLIKRKNPKIYSLGVSVAFRGKNISKTLLNATLLSLKALDFKKVTLEVRSDNVNAIRLYEEFGFCVKKREVGFYLDGCDAFIMERSLGD